MTNGDMLLRIPRFDIKCCLNGEGKTIENIGNVCFVVPIFGVEFEVHENGDVGIYLHILITGCVGWISGRIDVKRSISEGDVIIKQIDSTIIFIQWRVVSTIDTTWTISIA